MTSEAESSPHEGLVPVYLPPSVLNAHVGQFNEVGPFVAAGAAGQGNLLKELGGAIFEWVVGKTLDTATGGDGSLPAGWRSDGPDEIVYEGNYYILGIIPASIIPKIGLDPYAPKVSVGTIEYRCCDEDDDFEGVHVSIVLAASDLGFRNVRRSGVTSAEVHVHTVRDGQRLSLPLADIDLDPELQEQTTKGRFILPKIEACIPCEYITGGLINFSFTVRDEDRNVRIKRQSTPLPKNVRNCCGAA